LASEVRAPLAQISLGGAAIPGVLAVDIYSNNHFSADRFVIRLAAKLAPPGALQVLGQQLEIAISLNEVSRSLLVGVVDTVGFDPTTGLVSVEGRDLSALFIETQIDETFANRTASEIASMFAGRHGLAALVDQTTTAVGRYYQSEHNRVTLGQFAKTTTEWDLLAFLASREGFDLFLDGSTLRFCAAAPDVMVGLTVGDCLKMDLEQSVALGRPMTVTVKSWNSRAAETTVATAIATGLGTPWARTITRPNLTQDDAQRLATRTIADARRHVWTANVLMPGELMMTPRSQVSISTTGSAWDRTYAVSQISRHLDVKRGFTQRVTLQGLP